MATEYILVAEDSKPNQLVLTQMIKQFNFQVIVCDDGQEALNELEKIEDRNIVAIFSDIMMPNMDGISLFKKTIGLEIYEDVPFVFVTTVEDVESIMECMELGARGYILKPISMDSLTEKMQHLFPDRGF